MSWIRCPCQAHRNPPLSCHPPHLLIDDKGGEAVQKIGMVKELHGGHLVLDVLRTVLSSTEKRQYKIAFAFDFKTDTDLYCFNVTQSSTCSWNRNTVNSVYWTPISTPYAPVQPTEKFAKGINKIKRGIFWILFYLCTLFNTALSAALIWLTDALTT